AQVRADFAAEVAHAGEAGAQRLAGVADRAEGVVDRIQAEALRIALRTRLAAQVHVQVGPAGQAGTPGQRDRAGAGRGRRVARLHRADAAILDRDRVLPKHPAGAGIEPPLAGRRDRVGGRRRRGAGEQGKAQQAARHGSVAPEKGARIEPPGPDGPARGARAWTRPQRVTVARMTRPARCGRLAGPLAAVSMPCPRIPPVPIPPPTGPPRWRPPRARTGAPPVPTTWSSSRTGRSSSTCRCCRIPPARCTWATCAT